MKFGKTIAEKRALNSQKNLEKINGIRKFAFLPIRLETGEYIWLSDYYEYRSGFIIDEKYGYELAWIEKRCYEKHSEDYIRLKKYICQNNSNEPQSLLVQKV